MVEICLEFVFVRICILKHRLETRRAACGKDWVRNESRWKGARTGDGGEKWEEEPQTRTSCWEIDPFIYLLNKYLLDGYHICRRYKEVLSKSDLIKKETAKTD